MSTYVECYRCLVCNCLYSSKGPRVTYRSVRSVQDVLFNVIGARYIPSETHRCDDGNIGLAVLAGFVLKISEDD